LSDKKTIAVGVCCAILVFAMLAIQVFYYLPMIDRLNSQISTQQNQIDSKDAQISSLNSQIANLQSQISTIQSSGDALQAQYAELLQQYQTLLSRIPPDEGIQIDSMNVNSHGVTPSGVTQVVVRNLCSSDEVHITSLKLYSGEVLASSVAVLVTISANSTATINEYLAFKPLMTIYNLKIETLEGYTTTSDTILSHGS